MLFVHLGVGARKMIMVYFRGLPSQSIAASPINAGFALACFLVLIDSSLRPPLSQRGTTQAAARTFPLAASLPAQLDPQQAGFRRHHGGARSWRGYATSAPLAQAQSDTTEGGTAGVGEKEDRDSKAPATSPNGRLSQHEAKDAAGVGSADDGVEGMERATEAQSEVATDAGVYYWLACERRDNGRVGF